MTYHCQCQSLVLRYACADSIRVFIPLVAVNFTFFVLKLEQKFQVFVLIMASFVLFRFLIFDF